MNPSNKKRLASGINPVVRHFCVYGFNYLCIPAYRNQSYCFRLLVQVLKAGMCRSVHSIEVPGSGVSPSKVPSVSAWAGGVVPSGMAKR